MTDFYQELADYTGRDIDLVKARCQGASTELAWLFPEYKGRVLDYYRETDLYIFALSRYQTLLQDVQYQEWLAQFIRNYGIKRVLDYGGGIGEATIISCKAGAETCYLDIEGSKTEKYARWRFHKYNVRPVFFSEEYKIDQDFDLIIAMDVLEHIENPEPIIEAVAKHCTYLLSNPELVKYNVIFPEHISHFDLTPYFYNVHNYLWKRKEK